MTTISKNHLRASVVRKRKKEETLEGIWGVQSRKHAEEDGKASGW